MSKKTQHKTDSNSVFLDYLGYTLQKRRGKIQTGENHVRQGLSKVFVFFIHSSGPIPKSSHHQLYFKWVLVKFVKLTNEVKSHLVAWFGTNAPLIGIILCYVKLSMAWSCFYLNSLNVFDSHAFRILFSKRDQDLFSKVWHGFKPNKAWTHFH